MKVVGRVNVYAETGVLPPEDPKLVGLSAEIAGIRRTLLRFESFDMP